MFNQIDVCSICDEVGQCDFRASESVGDFICQCCGGDIRDDDSDEA